MKVSVHEVFFRAVQLILIVKRAVPAADTEGACVHKQ